MKIYSKEEIFKLWETEPDAIVRLVISGLEYVKIETVDPRLEDYIKKSLRRKAFRYVAKESTKGTAEATVMSTKCGFYEMNDGSIMQIGADYSKVTFTDRFGHHVTALRFNDEIQFRSDDGSSHIMKAWHGLHPDYIHMCEDLPGYYNENYAKSTAGDV